MKMKLFIASLALLGITSTAYADTCEDGGAITKARPNGTTYCVCADGKPSPGRDCRQVKAQMLKRGNVTKTVKTIRTNQGTGTVTRTTKTGRLNNGGTYQIKTYQYQYQSN